LYQGSDLKKKNRFGYKTNQASHFHQDVGDKQKSKAKEYRERTSSDAASHYYYYESQAKECRERASSEAAWYHSFY
jgi:hypothetical protein